MSQQAAEHDEQRGYRATPPKSAARTGPGRAPQFQNLCPELVELGPLIGSQWRCTRRR
jgi:hypothetical protein